MGNRERGGGVWSEEERNDHTPLLFTAEESVGEAIGVHTSLHISKFKPPSDTHSRRA